MWAGAAAPASIESLMGALGRVEGVEAAYTETVESALLATVLTRSGRLSYVAPERIVKTDAAGDGVEIDGERIRVRKDGAVEEFAVRDYLPLERLVAALRATFAGDLLRLRRDFTLDFATAPDGWTLVLRPRERALAAVFERMAIAGRGDLIARIDITEAGGDRRTMVLNTDLIRRRPAAP